MTCNATLYNARLRERQELVLTYELSLTAGRKCEVARKIKACEDSIKEVGQLNDSFFKSAPWAKRCLCHSQT